MNNAAVASPELQLSWHNGALHLWALHRDDGRIVHLVELIREADRLLGRHGAAAALPTRIPIQLPEPLGMQPVPTLRMPLATLIDIPQFEQAGTLRWFASLAMLAESVVRAGCIRPTLTANGPIYAARWAAVLEHSLEVSLDEARALMPPACAISEIAAFFNDVVDALARQRLGELGWRPSPPQQARGTHYRAAQATFRALSSASGSVLYRTDDISALGELARSFDLELDRAQGVPVVAPQLRLHLPSAADDPWCLTLELFDIDQPQRWCTASDIITKSALALDIARQPQHVDRLRSRIEAAAQMLGLHLDALEPLATDPTVTIELSLEQIETFLVDAPSVLDDLDVRLLGPEHLSRAKATTHATATPKPDMPSSGRFSAIALMQWDATIDDTPVDEAQLERAAASGNSLIHVNGRWVRLDPEQVKATLGQLYKHRKDHAELDVAGLLKLAAETATINAATDATVALRTDGWIAELLAGLPDEQLEELHEPASFVGELRHYQRRGLSWMGFLARLGLGGCLADDMGLGKTATALAHLATRPGPHLVVCPLSVVHNWYSEAARFTPHMQVAIHHGGERARGTAAAEQLIPSDIVVTTYGLLARDIDALSEVRWGTLVLDEAQNVKNHLTRAARAVRHINADQKLALTGTPVENHLGELWAILDAVNPGLYGSAHSFNDRYAKPIQRTGDPAATAALRALTQPFILRRTKADRTLLPELPDKIEQIAWATLTREQATMYQAVVDQLLADAQAQTGMKRRGIVLAALTRLKQICNHPAHAAGDGSRLAARSGKLTRFDELIDDLLEVGERALVFTQFREMGLLLQRHLRERLRIDAPFLHGGVTRHGRTDMVQRFQSGEGAALLLVSLKAGGTGLNLTAASQVIHYDRWWNPAVEDQATDRAWRLGQAHTVLVHKLVCEGTLEERISQLIDDKKQLANSVLGTGEQWLTELSTDALRSLVTLTPGTQT